MMQRKDLAEQARRDARQKGLEALQEFDPEYWYRHDEELGGELSMFKDAAAQLMVMGIDNPLASTDPRARDLQKYAKKLKTKAKLSEELRENFGALQKHYNNPVYRGRIENWGEVSAWYQENSLDEIIDNKLEPPKLKWKAPLEDGVAEMNKVLKDYDALNGGKPITRQDADALAQEIMNDPARLEAPGMGLVGMVQQIVSGLGPEERKLAEKDAKRSGQSVTEFYLSRMLYDRKSGEEVNLLDVMQQNAARVGRKKVRTQKIEGGRYVTKEGDRVEDESQKAREVAKAALQVNTAQIEREVERGMYGDPTASLEENLEAAVDYYTPQVTFGRTYKEEERLTSTSQADRAAMDDSYELWYENLTSEDDIATANAASFLQKYETPDGLKVVAATVEPDTEGDYTTAGSLVLDVVGSRDMIANYDYEEINAVEVKKVRSGSTVEQDEYRIVIPDVSDPKVQEVLREMYLSTAQKGKRQFTQDYRPDEEDPARLRNEAKEKRKNAGLPDF
jgi:hypothetical protein